jgi:F-type H+/Na+-transporting ATPase subunit beta
MEQPTGRVVQIQGSVVDVEFPHGSLPEIYEAVEVVFEGDKVLVLEVQKLLEGGWARCVSMGATDGMQRGLPVRRTHQLHYGAGWTANIGTGIQCVRRSCGWQRSC